MCIRDSIYNIDSWCEAAIRVNSSNNLIVTGNVVHDITASGVGGDGRPCREANGIRFDSRNALVENNLVFNAGKFGILADNGSGGTVRNNTLFNNGTDFESRGSAQTSNNLTSDGTNGRQVSSNVFVGPLTGQANSGSGVGTGFELLAGVGGFTPS